VKILLLAPQPFYQERGTPIAVKMLAEDLYSSGHDIELLTYHEGEEPENWNIEIHRIVSIPGLSNISPGFSIKKIICDGLMFLQAIRLCLKKKYDVVHAVEESVFIAVILKMVFNTRCVYDVDSWLSDQLQEKYQFLRCCKGLFSFFEKIAVTRSDGAVVVCKALEEKVKQFDPNIPVLRLEDVSLLQEFEGDFESLETVVGNNDPFILYVGNLEKYQGINLLLDSFKIICEKNKKCNLVIIGGTEETREKYVKIAEELAIDSRVFFIGTRPLENLSMYLMQASILVSPRIKGENTPMKVYSYLASGVPLVATKIKSHTQVLDDTVACIADPDPRSFAMALERVLGNKQLAGDIGTAAKHMVAAQYSRPAFKKKITEFYSHLTYVWNLRN